MTDSPKFSIQGSKGFQIVFANNVRVSVQFGPGNYCDNYDKPWDDKSPARSANAEVAIINDTDGSWLTQTFVPDAGDDVLARVSANDLLALMNKAAAWESKP